MSEAKMISPMLDNFIMGSAMSEHHGVRCYPAIDNQTGEKHIVKVISVPSSPSQLDAMILSGAYPDRDSALTYFKGIADDLVQEIDVLERLSELEGFLSYTAYQVDAPENGEGYDIYLLSPYKRSLQKHFTRHSFTHLDALNLGLDLCAALSVARRNGYMYIDLKPSNVYVTDQRLFRIGDLGFIRLSALKYASMPDKYMSVYTPPEIRDAFSALNTTMDIYAAGLILYQTYNNGELPFHDTVQPGDPLPAPLYADYEMSEIILKACAVNPEDRWQDPMEMGQAIVSYMQRNGAIDKPIVPAPEPVAEESAEDASAVGMYESTSDDTSVAEEALTDEEIAAEAAVSADSDKSLSEDDVASVDTLITPVPTEEIEEITAEEKPGEVAADEDPAVEPEDIIPEEIPLETVTAEEPAETAPFEEPEYLIPVEESVETAPAEMPDDDSDEIVFVEYGKKDAFDTAEDFEDEDEEVIAEEADYESLTDEASEILNQADELAAMDVPDPVVVPDFVEVSIPEWVAPDSPADADTEEDNDADGEELSEDDADSPIVLDDLTSISDENPRKKSHKLRNAILIAVCLLALLIGGFLFMRRYYVSPIDIVSIDGNMDTLTVYISTEIKEENLKVICSDTYGNKLTAPVINGKAEFTGLVANTAYSIKVTASGLHRLTGTASTAYSTPIQSNIVQFDAVTGATEDSVIVRFTVEGPNCNEWSIVYSAEGEEERTAKFTSHMVTLSNLTVGKDYTMRLVPGEDLYITGQDTIIFTARKIVKAENLQVISCLNNTLTVQWDAPDGEAVSSWSVHCFNDTYNQTIITSDTTASFKDLDHSGEYTVEVKAAGMSISQSTQVSANSVTASNFRGDLSDPTKIVFTWDASQPIPEDGWLLQYSVNGIENEVTIPCTSNTATIYPVIPNAEYHVYLQDIEGNVLLGSKAEIITTAPVDFAKQFGNFNGTREDLTFTICRTPKFANWGRFDLNASDYTSDFTVGDNASYLVKFDGLHNEPDEEVIISYVIRNESNTPVLFGVQSNTWKAMWPTTYCKLNVPAIPATEGSYTMEVYFNGMLVHEQPFTVSK